MPGKNAEGSARTNIFEVQLIGISSKLWSLSASRPQFDPRLIEVYVPTAEAVKLLIQHSTLFILLCQIYDRCGINKGLPYVACFHQQERLEETTVRKDVT